MLLFFTFYILLLFFIRDNFVERDYKEWTLRLREGWFKVGDRLGLSGFYFLRRTKAEWLLSVLSLYLWDKHTRVSYQITSKQQKDEETYLYEIRTIHQHCEKTSDPIKLYKLVKD